MARTGRPRTVERTWRKCEQCGIEYEWAEWEKSRRRFHERACYLAWRAEHRKPAPPIRVVPTTCTLDGCGRPHKGRGYCEMHLVRWRKYGDPTVVRKKQPHPELRPRCTVIENGKQCENLRAGGGLCQKHYMKVYRRGGDPAETLARGNFSTPVSTRTHLFVQGEPDECWTWQGAVNKHGYGITGVRGVGGILAHRAVYEEMVGPIGYDADGEPLTLDHLCANRLCVNPNHLEPVSRYENKVRGGEPHFQARGKTARVTWE